MFDSHVATLLSVTVSLVNDLTDGSRGGKPYVAPGDEQLISAVARVLPSVSDPQEIDHVQALSLATAAQQMRLVFVAVDDERLDDAAEAVNALLRTTGTRPQLDRVPGEPWQVHFHGYDDSDAVGWSAGCAAALALAIGSDLAGRLGVCGAPRCDRVYVDGSRNSARQFCSLACQNRVKAAAYRARGSH
ncbi:CGNR zinc finger domain-containing protein [Streptomyces sp. RLB3-17]|nr:CGNR zinc finger domain-containing protein [Streptomyces sp. RLA2-12]QDN61380.1 CGNR zinc finger domain-containing protein [Streptomyces sp. S1D4-20]QDN71433.1 CGNR zinc finger domain-containing protein [Streptomyces sp. S1D4-14]QDO43974.1 CGNR zinc finger domain-containing protein [Streptomyces sp. RLB3-17]QDO53889.1 CGNR zinc finger domain-containing protein [Streptomyces sp. RLB3-5]QDO64133.1 CGNR zinc finger domain-containing protein [Streptomyces sp. RLB1-8]